MSVIIDAGLKCCTHCCSQK